MAEKLTWLLAEPNGPNLQSEAIVTWGVRNLIPIILLFIGISIMASARRGRISDNANTLTNVLLGGVVIASAAALYTFSEGISNLIFGS